MSDVGAMVEELIAAGTPPEVAASIVARAFVAGVESASVRRHPVDATADKRRAYDRERKRLSRGSPPEKVDIPRMSENASLSKEEILESKERKREAIRGARLPDNWHPHGADWMVAGDLLGEHFARGELEKFKDHWKQQPGAKGVKLDWNAAWRNWARRAAEYRGKGNGKNPQGGSAIDAWDRLRAKAAGDDRDEGQDAFLLLPPGPIPRS